MEWTVATVNDSVVGLASTRNCGYSCFWYQREVPGGELGELGV